MALTKFEIVERTPFDDGREFGAVGPYERIEAVAHYTIDPAHRANHTLVDVEYAERCVDGLVHFNGDVSMLVPCNPERGNRTVLVEVPNRGKRVAQRQFNQGPIQVELSRHIDPGDGFLMRHGWSVAWCGWQWDVPPGPEGMGIRPPQVDPTRGPGQHGPGQMQLRVQPSRLRHHIPLTDQHVGALGRHQTIPTRDLNDPQAVLMVRDSYYAEPEVIPRDAWRFARTKGKDDVSPVEDPDHMWLEGGFKPGKVYDIVYSPAPCPWNAAGLAAMRDLGSFLKNHPDSPLHGHVDHAIAEGISQCGRFLRTYLHAGLNLDELGATVYDGMLIHIAGGRRGEFNHRYAQPSVQPTPSFGHLFPFADLPQVNGQTNETAGLLDRLREHNAVPKIFYTDTAAEYWRGDASLAHTDVNTGEDVPLPAEVRRYLYAGSQHSPGLLPLSDENVFGTRGVNLFNFIDYRPLYRASLENLREWITNDVEPPPSAYPQQSNQTAAERSAVIDALESIPSCGVPDPTVLTEMHPIDLGPDAARGIGVYPARRTGHAYPCRVSAVDDDGNEIGGVAMPEVSVPVATHTGFAPRHDSIGGGGQLLEYMGSSIPFARDRAEREETGDPRPAISERYEDRATYLEQVRAAAHQLIKKRLLLAEDENLCVAIAAARYDAVMSRK